MIGATCALLSALGFFFSVGLGEQWWLAWLAPIPVLWFAFGDSKAIFAFVVAFAAMAIGASNILDAYFRALPVFVLAMAIAGPALLFALAVLGARRAFIAFGSAAAMLTFAGLWTGFEFLESFSSAGGSVATVAASQVGAPGLIQTASLVGYLGITFLLGIVSAGLALGLRRRAIAPVAIALAVLAANAGYGQWRMSTPASSHLRVALIESDNMVGSFRSGNEAATMKAVDAYVTEIEKLRGRGVELVVLPENISRVMPSWRAQVEARFQRAADSLPATIVAGFNTKLDGAQRNVSLAFAPGAKTPVVYEKRKLVPVLESAVFTPGPGPRALASGIGLEICKDMDFQAMIRADELATHPVLLAVPAWDFDKDDWSHARVAVLRSVENGVAMARTARDGLLTLNDRYGRIVARARSAGGFTTLVGTLPLDGRGGTTVYDRIGDVLGWISLVLGWGLVAASAVRRAHHPIA